MSVAAAVGILSWVRLYWGWLNNVDVKWKHADETLLQSPPAFADIPPREGNQTSATPPDEVQTLLHQLPPSKSSWTNSPPSCQEFGTQLQAKLVKDDLRSGIQIRLVPSGAQIAGSLTNVMCWENVCILEKTACMMRPKCWKADPMPAPCSNGCDTMHRTCQRVKGLLEDKPSRPKCTT